MDDQGRFTIPGQFRKDGKPFIGETFEETKVLEEPVDAAEGNRHERRRAAALDAELRKIKDVEAELADREAFARRQQEPAK